MSTPIDATYRDGAIIPAAPLDLPDNTPLRVVVVLQAARIVGSAKTRDEILALRPKAPTFTGEQLEAAIRSHAVSVGSLPPDFSRADIYSDHD